jgi:xylulokinase
MKTSLYMGVDIGTSVVKGLIIDAAGNPISKTSFVRQNNKQSPIKYEDDADQVWWNEFLRITKNLLQDLGSSKENVQRIAVTAMVPNILPIDAQGRPLRNAVLYYDGRAKSIEEQLDAELGTAKWQNLVLAKLISLKTELGSEWKNVHKILSTHNYIVFRLTGKICVDTITSLECGNVLDSHKIEWNQDLLERYDLNENVLPEIVSPATIVGCVSREASESTGLAEGTSVVAGTTDSTGTIIGSGARNRNDMIITYGTYGSASILLNDLKEVMFKKRLDYPINWAASLPRSGQQLSALAQVLLPSDSPHASLSKLDGLAATSIPGANGVVFIQMLDLVKSVESTEPRGAVFNLGKDITMADICRAMLEAFGYGLRYCLGTFPEGVIPHKCFAAGGGARSKIWRQIVSDITGLEQSYFPYSTTAFGAAVLAAVADAPEVWEQLHEFQSRRFEIVFPSIQNDKEYGAAYQAYKDYLERLSDLQAQR